MRNKTGARAGAIHKISTILVPTLTLHSAEGRSVLLNQAMQSLLNGEKLEFSIRNLAKVCCLKIRGFSTKNYRMCLFVYDFALIFVKVILLEINV